MNDEIASFNVQINSLNKTLQSRKAILDDAFAKLKQALIRPHEEDGIKSKEEAFLELGKQIYDKISEFTEEQRNESGTVTELS
ncbi:UNVERIFIED_CONTAM: hypothetical protein O8I53_06230 [Campylobacter lari]